MVLLRDTIGRVTWTLIFSLEWLVEEAPVVSHTAEEFAHVPGIHMDAQIQSWKMVYTSLLTIPNSYCSVCL